MPHLLCQNCGASGHYGPKVHICHDCGAVGHLTGSFVRCGEPHPGVEEKTCQLPEEHDGEHSAIVRLRWG